MPGGRIRGSTEKNVRETRNTADGKQFLKLIGGGDYGVRQQKLGGGGYGLAGTEKFVQRFLGEIFAARFTGERGGRYGERR